MPLARRREGKHLPSAGELHSPRNLQAFRHRPQSPPRRPRHLQNYGQGNLKLTAFGIEPPCQLGVCVTDDVQLKLEFQAKELRQVSKK